MSLSTDEVRAFLAAEDRERKKRLKEIIPRVTCAEDAIRLAPALRGPSPRVAARITAMLAKFGLEEELERQLHGLKPGKTELLRKQFRRITKSD